MQLIYGLCLYGLSSSLQPGTAIMRDRKRKLSLLRREKKQVFDFIGALLPFDEDRSKLQSALPLVVATTAVGKMVPAA